MKVVERGRLQGNPSEEEARSPAAQARRGNASTLRGDRDATYQIHGRCRKVAGDPGEEGGRAALLAAGRRLCSQKRAEDTWTAALSAETHLRMLRRESGHSRQIKRRPRSSPSQPSLSPSPGMGEGGALTPAPPAARRAWEVSGHPPPWAIGPPRKEAGHTVSAQGPRGHLWA